MAVSKLMRSELFFVEPDIKVGDRYYQDLLLKQQMLSVIMRWTAQSAHVFQQDSTIA